MKPVIVCDIDDVIFPFIPGITQHYNELKGTKITAEDFFSFDLAEVWGLTVDEATEIVELFLTKPLLELRPLDGVEAAFTRLKEDFDIVLVTARNGIFEQSTRNWLTVHLPDLFKDVIFAGNQHDGRGYRTKGEICKELGALLIIDDHPANILSAIQAGADGILFGTKAWSVRDELPDVVASCEDWDEVLEYIYGEWRTRRVS